MIKVCYIATHPIQNQAPLLRELAKIHYVDLEVLFASTWGIREGWDSEFGVKLAWDVPLLQGYRSQFIGLRLFDRSNPSAVPVGFGLLRKIAASDAVIVRGYSAIVEWQSIVAAWLLRKPLFMMPEGYDLDQDPESWKYRVRRAVLGRLYRRIRGFLSISSLSSEHFLSNGGLVDRLVSAPYCVDNDFFDPRRVEGKDTLRREIRTKLGIPADAFALLFCGKLSTRKNPQILIEALQLSSESNIYVIFVGDGELREALLKQAESVKQRVKFVGFQNQTFIRQYYWAGDALALPSLYGETWGLVANEAMAAGIPVIVSDRVGCSRDLIVPGVTGFSFNTGDRRDFLRCLEAIARAKPGAAPRDANAIFTHISKFSPTKVAASMAEGIKRLLAK